MVPDEAYASTAGARPRLLRPCMQQHCRSAVWAHAMAGAGSAMVKAGRRTAHVDGVRVTAQRTEPDPAMVSVATRRDGGGAEGGRRPEKG